MSDEDPTTGIEVEKTDGRSLEHKDGGGDRRKDVPVLQKPKWKFKPLMLATIGFYVEAVLVEGILQKVVGGVPKDNKLISYAAMGGAADLPLPTKLISAGKKLGKVGMVKRALDGLRKLKGRLPGHIPAGVDGATKFAIKRKKLLTETYSEGSAALADYEYGDQSWHDIRTCKNTEFEQFVPAGQVSVLRGGLLFASGDVVNVVFDGEGTPDRRARSRGHGGAKPAAELNSGDLSANPLDWIVKTGASMTLSVSQQGWHLGPLGANPNFESIAKRVEAIAKKFESAPKTRSGRGEQRRRELERLGRT